MLKLTCAVYDMPMYLNPDMVQEVRKTVAGGVVMMPTSIVLCNGQVVLVKEVPGAVEARIAASLQAKVKDLEDRLMEAMRG